MFSMNPASNMCLTEKSVQIISAKMEDARQTIADEYPMCYPPEPTPRHDIMNNVFHLDAASDGLKTMFVVPEPERAYALLVNKPAQAFDMLDLGHPCHGNAGHGRNAIGDHETSINLFRHFRGDLEIEKRWGDRLQGSRRREECPCFLKGDGQELFVLESMDSHGDIPADLSQVVDRVDLGHPQAFEPVYLVSINPPHGRRHRTQLAQKMSVA